MKQLQTDEVEARLVRTLALRADDVSDDDVSMGTEHAPPPSDSVLVLPVAEPRLERQRPRTRVLVGAAAVTVVAAAGVVAAVLDGNADGADGGDGDVTATADPDSGGQPRPGTGWWGGDLSEKLAPDWQGDVAVLFDDPDRTCDHAQDRPAFIGAFWATNDPDLPDIVNLEERVQAGGYELYEEEVPQDPFYDGTALEVTITFEDGAIGLWSLCLQPDELLEYAGTMEKDADTGHYDLTTPSGVTSEGQPSWWIDTGATP